ncbi:hypothetical protein IWZ03DRAFT_73512 [Phyllosticta citriasiana]|uniref:Secreted protein n=1 Tax=Phyllosticta citriasiana TaxID=595635 RepID=A0ABR1KAP1_9PEZI
MHVGRLTLTSWIGLLRVCWAPLHRSFVGRRVVLCLARPLPSRTSCCPALPGPPPLPSPSSSQTLSFISPDPYLQYQGPKSLHCRAPAPHPARLRSRLRRPPHLS